MQTRNPIIAAKLLNDAADQTMLAENNIAVDRLTPNTLWSTYASVDSALIQPWVRGCLGCAAFSCRIVTKHDEEDSGDHHPDWCDEKVHEQLGAGLWAKSVSEGRDAGKEVHAPIEEERLKEQVGLEQRRVVCKS
jgi:hypothetical protein